MKSFVRKAFRSVKLRFSGTITHVATDEPLVALTFDDGPDPLVTPALLKILGAHGAKATFFMTGENAAAYPELVAAVRDAGHAIGNHSWDHPSFPLVSGSERRRQIKRCESVLPATDTPIFRPPYGNQSVASRIDATLTGYSVVTWNVCVPDWEDHDGNWLADFTLRNLKPGCVVLMHDGMFDFMGDTHSDRGPTLDAVEKILAESGKRFEFVTVPDLLRRGRAVRVAWWMKPDVGFLNRLTRRNGDSRRYAVT
jgi:peptidoglycan/xylan/chitin deacetylase (PgdA/CDA1 family)